MPDSLCTHPRGLAMLDCCPPHHPVCVPMQAIIACRGFTNCFETGFPGNTGFPNRKFYLTAKVAGYTLRINRYTRQEETTVPDAIKWSMYSGAAEYSDELTPRDLEEDCLALLNGVSWASIDIPPLTGPNVRVRNAYPYFNAAGQVAGHRGFATLDGRTETSFGSPLGTESTYGLCTVAAHNRYVDHWFGWVVMSRLQIFVTQRTCLQTHRLLAVPGYHFLPNDPDGVPICDLEYEVTCAEVPPPEPGDITTLVIEPPAIPWPINNDYVQRHFNGSATVQEVPTCREYNHTDALEDCSCTELLP